MQQASSEGHGLSLVHEGEAAWIKHELMWNLSRSLKVERRPDTALPPQVKCDSVTLLKCRSRYFIVINVGDFFILIKRSVLQLEVDISSSARVRKV